ncbi:MAG: hypothetical protein J6Q38_04385 [Clostridia bacterium]|nr:hypothetical protein [Clostridia bacterium]
MLLKSKLKKIFLVAVISLLMLFLIIFPEQYIKSCLNGIILWATTVLPSLLPFFFLTQLLTKTQVLNGLTKKAERITKPLFKCGGLSVYAFVMSILSGYPVGSRIVYDLKSQNLITEGEATKIGLLASTSGPLFVIGAIGVGMFKSKTIGFIIYITHVLSAIIVAILFRNYKSENKNALYLNQKINESNVLYESIYNAVISVLIVGGFISIFYVFSEILQDFKILYPIEKFLEIILFSFKNNTEIAKAFTVGLIECTKGAKSLSLINNYYLTAPLTAGLISFGGVSIIMQSLIYLIKSGVKPSIFILGKVTQTFISIISSYILIQFAL